MLPMIFAQWGQRNGAVLLQSHSGRTVGRHRWLPKKDIGEGVPLPSPQSTWERERERAEVSL
jgi:hypothetical protein